jgi:tetratricopeptide (TPR) repeat protein
MSFARIVMGCLAISVAIHAVLPSDLIFTPTADFPSRGHTELGYQLSYYTIQSRTYDEGVYFNHSVSKTIRWGLEHYRVNDTNYLYYHFAYRLGSLFHQSKYRLFFAGTVNYLSHHRHVLTTDRMYDGSLTATWSPYQQPFQAHVTLARAITNARYYVMGAVSYTKDWGHLSIEWDGAFMNFSSQFDIYKRLNFRAGVTKNTQNNTEVIFKSAIGIIDIFSADTPSLPPTMSPEPLPTVNTQMGLTHIQDGLTFYYKGDYANARKSYEIARELLPNSATVRERLGSIYYQLGEFDNARIEWEKANVLAPSARLQQFIIEAKAKGESVFE